jgi:bifunctional enzyme CysN/CysC
LIGIRHVVLAVNKMDLVGFDRATFDRIVADYRAFAGGIGLGEVLAIPMSGLEGDNITEKSARTPWYDGPSLVEHLETVEVDSARLQRGPFRMPVQWVNRPDQDFRGFAGQIAGGQIRPGDPVRILPSGVTSSVARIVAHGGDLSVAAAGQSVTLTLTSEVDCSRGDVISAADTPAQRADQFETAIGWMSDEPMLRGRPYWMKVGAKTVSATVTAIKHKVNVNTMEQLAARTLELNEIGVCNLSLDNPIAFDPYADNHDLGGFILIDRMTNATVAAGMIRFALRRSDNVHWQALDVNREARASLMAQRAGVLWFTGLSGAGKSTIANIVEKKLHALGVHTVLLDGDNVRHGLNRDLGFTDADRVENVRRVAEVAKLMTDAGLIVLVSFISPFRAERDMARQLMHADEFLEIHVDTPLAEAEKRDVKGLYKKARAGQLKNFTGIDSPYEPPPKPELRVDTVSMSAEQAADAILSLLRSRGHLDSGDGI